MPETFQTMNVKFGLFPPIEAGAGGRRRPRGRERKQALSARALKDLDAWLGETRAAAE